LSSRLLGELGNAVVGCKEDAVGESKTGDKGRLDASELTGGVTEEFRTTMEGEKF
jgi:hypothetical protein